MPKKHEHVVTLITLERDADGVHVQTVTDTALSKTLVGIHFDDARQAATNLQEEYGSHVRCWIAPDQDAPSAQP